MKWITLVVIALFTFQSFAKNNELKAHIDEPTSTATLEGSKFDSENYIKSRVAHGVPQKKWTLF